MVKDGSGEVSNEKQLRSVLKSKRSKISCQKLHNFLVDLRDRKDNLNAVFYPVFDDILATFWGFYADRIPWIEYVPPKYLFSIMSPGGSLFNVIFNLLSFPPVTYSVPIKRLPVGFFFFWLFLFVSIDFDNSFLCLPPSVTLLLSPHLPPY